MLNIKLKQKAIRLRKRGHTYSEILRVIPIAKSTLSEWLKEVGLSIPQQQKITEKRKAGQRRRCGGAQNPAAKIAGKHFCGIYGGNRSDIEKGIMAYRHRSLLGGRCKRKRICSRCTRFVFKFRSENGFTFSCLVI